MDLKMLLDDVNILAEIILFIALLEVENYVSYLTTLKRHLNTYLYDDEVEVEYGVVLLLDDDDDEVEM